MEPVLMEALPILIASFVTGAISAYFTAKKVEALMITHIAYLTHRLDSHEGDIRRLREKIHSHKCAA